MEHTQVKRDPLLVFTIITLGIYGLYWVYVTTKEVNTSSDSVWNPSPVEAVLFPFITFGIYRLYWNYKMWDLACRRSGNKDGFLILFLLNLFIFSSWFSSFTSRT